MASAIINNGNKARLSFLWKGEFCWAEEGGDSASLVKQVQLEFPNLSVETDVYVKINESSIQNKKFQIITKKEGGNITTSDELAVAAEKIQKMTVRVFIEEQPVLSQARHKTFYSRDVQLNGIAGLQNGVAYRLVVRSDDQHNFSANIERV